MTSQLSKSWRIGMTRSLVSYLDVYPKLRRTSSTLHMTKIIKYDQQATVTEIENRNRRGDGIDSCQSLKTFLSSPGFRSFQQTFELLGKRLPHVPRNTIQKDKRC